ncbi:unnamed protein product [Adineta steineri]|uniref:Beta-catenin-interacting ICAT domain-containing protein n=1 Tax=Adineta steineri TaxID=433720 RepID=A0A813PG21_9BILA|nr:unnamed protein product [Adineta steineri]CAF0753630.1 unnamed protein product [Adineta steineri]
MNHDIDNNDDDESPCQSSPTHFLFSIDEEHASLNKNDAKRNENFKTSALYKCHSCRKIQDNPILTCSECVNTGQFCSSKHEIHANKRREFLLNMLNKNDYEEFQQHSNSKSNQLPYSDRMFLLKKFNAEKQILQSKLQKIQNSSIEIQHMSEIIQIRKQRLHLIHHAMKNLREQIERKQKLNSVTKDRIEATRSRVEAKKPELNDISKAVELINQKNRKIRYNLTIHENRLNEIRREHFDELYKYIFPIEQVSAIEEDDAIRIRNLSIAQQTTIGGVYDESTENNETVNVSDYRYQIVNSYLSKNGDYQIDKLVSIANIDTNMNDPDSPQSSLSRDLYYVVSALSHACQLINVIASYLHIHLPFRLHHIKFNTDKLSIDCLRADIAKLNTNIIFSCLSQGIPIEFTNSTYTLENLRTLLKVEKYLNRPRPVIYGQNYIDIIERDINEINRTFITDYWFDDYDEHDDEEEVINILNNSEWETIAHGYYIPDDRFSSDDDNSLPTSTSQQNSSIMSSSIDKIMPSSSSASSSSYFLQEMSYPPYCIQPLKSWGMIAVGGGGGTAKTGVGNAVDLKWIYLNQSSDPNNSKCSIENINSFSQHDSVMRMVSLRKQNEYLILALNRHLKVIMLKASHVDLNDESLKHSASSASLSINTLEATSLSKGIHRRKNSSSSDLGKLKRRSSTTVHRYSSATVEAVGNETSTVVTPSSLTPTIRINPLSRIGSTSSIVTIKNLNNIYTVPIQEYEYVNALVVCPATQSKLFVGASDGSLTIYEIIWPSISSSDRLIHLNILTSFTAHNKEIDDLAIDPFGRWLISVSRDHHVQIRQCSPPFDKHNEIDPYQFGKNKTVTPARPLYRIRHVRFGIASISSNTQCFLYTSLIPQSITDKLNSYIVQWYENKQHKFIVRLRRRVSYDCISAMAVSNCGQYVSIGDSIGCVRIYETNRLILLYEHCSHTIFVTDLAFIFREENYLYETSVLNIFKLTMSAQTDVLRNNLHAQLDRLLEQLTDLDQTKDDMDVDEYNEARQDTVDQLEDFSKSLEKMKSGEGGLSLLDEVQRIQNAIKCAISQAFQTPEVIRFFAKKQPVQLRNRLAEIERDTKVGKMNAGEGARQKKEILDALKKLGETLTGEEEIYLKQYSDSGNANFAKMNDSSDVNVNALSAVAAKQIENARAPR